jgi:catalase (peroxidase I)
VDKEYEEISRRYVERAKKYTEELQAKWKEAMDKAIAFQEEFQEEFKQEKK